MRWMQWPGGWVLLAGCAATSSQIAALPGDAATATADVGAPPVDVATTRPDVVAPPVDASTTMDGAVLDAFAGDGGAGSDAVSPGVCADFSPGLLAGCNPATRWPVMLAQPVIPLVSAAGLTFAGATGAGLTFEAAEETNCTGTLDGDPFGDGRFVVEWGRDGEVWAEFTPTTCVVSQITLWPGTTGTLSFSDAAHAHHYVVPLNAQITKDGMPYTLNWNDPVLGPQEFDELNRALRATFDPTAATDPVGSTCIATGTCRMGTFGDVGYVNYPALHVALWVASVSAPQPTPSIINRIDLSPAP